MTIYHKVTVATALIFGFMLVSFQSFAASNCNLRLSGDETTTMKQFAFQRLSDYMGEYETMSQNVFLYNTVYDNINGILNNPLYGRVAPRSIKTCFNKLLNEVDVKYLRTKKEKKAHKRRTLESHQDAIYSVKILKSCQIENAISTLGRTMISTIKKTKTAFLKRSRASARDKIGDINEMIFALREIGEMLEIYDRKIAQIAWKEFRYQNGAIFMEEVEEAHAYVKKCNYKGTEADRLFQDIKTAYEADFRTNFVPNVVTALSPNNIYQDFVTKITASYNYGLPEYRLWLTKADFYRDNYMGQRSVPIENQTEGDKTLVSIRLNDARPNSPVLYSRLDADGLKFDLLQRDAIRDFETYYPPFAYNTSYTMRLGTNASFFATDKLSGCGLQVFGSTASPFVTHANANGFGNSAGNQIAKANAKANTMGQLFDQILITNGAQLGTAAANGVLRVFFTNNAAVAQQNNGWTKETRTIEYLKNGYPLTEDVVVYTYHYPLLGTFIAKSEADKWGFTFLKFKAYSKAYSDADPIAVWPIPTAVKQDF